MADIHKQIIEEKNISLNVFALKLKAVGFKRVRKGVWMAPAGYNGGLVDIAA